MLVLGIDPGISLTGYGLVKHSGSRLVVADFGLIKTNANLELPKRLRMVYEKISNVIHKYTPDAMAIERVYFNKNASSAMTVGHARGVILLLADIHSIPVYEYTPQHVKSAVTGYGKADKQQVGRMVKSLLNLEKVPKPDDVSDALALAIAHRALSRLEELTAQGV